MPRKTEKATSAPKAAEPKPAPKPAPAPAIASAPAASSASPAREEGTVAGPCPVPGPTYFETEPDRSVWLVPQVCVFQDGHRQPCGFSPDKENRRLFSVWNEAERRQVKV